MISRHSASSFFSMLMAAVMMAADPDPAARAR